MESLQEKYSPNAVCFGCGPKNAKGLHIKSYPKGDFVVADWNPEPYHIGYQGFANGGIISTVADCHGNMTAAYALMKANGLETPPGTVTAELTIKFLKPTPIDGPLHIEARATRIEGRKVMVEGTIETKGIQTASMSGVFVSVKEEHPGFTKWGSLPEVKRRRPKISNDT